jgi:hypothetical protein
MLPPEWHPPPPLLALRSTGGNTPMPFDDAGFPDDAEPKEALWLRYGVAVLLTLALAALPMWGLWRIASHAVWNF